ncbi:hypothetical protein [Nocardia nova]
MRDQPMTERPRTTGERLAAIDYALELLRGRNPLALADDAHDDALDTLVHVRREIHADWETDLALGLKVNAGIVRAHLSPDSAPDAVGAVVRAAIAEAGFELTKREAPRNGR